MIIAKFKSLIAPEPACGFIEGEPSDYYHGTKAWGKSKLDDFRRRPLYAYRKHVARSLVEDFDSVAYQLGRMAHALILEGESVYTSRYLVEPEFGDLRKTKRTTTEQAKENKTRKEQWGLANANTKQIIVSAEEDVLTRKMLAATHRNATVRALLDEPGGIPEVTCRTKMRRYSLQCRPDWFIPSASEQLCNTLKAAGIIVDVGEPIIVDLKTVASLAEDEFNNFDRNFFRFGYYRAAPFYTAVTSEAIGRPVKQFLFVAVEKSEPFECIAFRPTTEAMELGYREIVADLKDLGECYERNFWPDAPQSVQSINVPEWYLRRSALGGVQ